MNNFFVGMKKDLSEVDIEQMKDIINSAKFQGEFCEYLLHTSK